MSEIIADSVSLSFSLNTSKRRSLKRLLTGERNTCPAPQVNAIHDLTFHITEGERVGLLGHNGAGKSTLLRTVAGIYRPSQGRLSCQGRVTPLFHGGGSFNPELTGRENVLQTSILMRLDRETALQRMDSILEFAEVRDYADMPVKTYSRGMATRLAFATLTSDHPDILLLDEALGGGDLSFRDKAQQRLEELMGRSAILLIASHQLTLMAKVCTRVIRLENGRIIDDGEPERLLLDYRKQNPSRYQHRAA